MGVARSRGRVGLRLIAAHPCVEEIANSFEFLEAFNDQFRARRAGGGLDLYIGKAEPALNEIGTQMNVLDARISEVHFAAEKKADSHVNAFLIETIAQGVIAKIKIRQRDNNRGSAEHGR